VALGTGLVPAAVDAQVPPRPDALIRTPSQRAYSGDGIYNTTGAGQSRSAVIGQRGLTRFYVQVQNDSRSNDDIRVVGTRESAAFAVRYFLGSRQVSPLVKAGTLTFSGMAPGATRALTVEVEAKAGAPLGSSRRVVVSARSAADGSVRDNVVANVRIPQYSAEQRRIVELVNQSRARYGRAGVALRTYLRDKAQAWAEKMAREGHLSHSHLSDGVPRGWRGLAENVGYGNSIVQVHNAFMSSPPHRANLLGNYNHIGTGYATGFGRVWIVQVFELR
jgi:uncharacterized protein YkwD